MCDWDLLWLVRLLKSNFVPPGQNIVPQLNSTSHLSSLSLSINPHLLFLDALLDKLSKTRVFTTFRYPPGTEGDPNLVWSVDSRRICRNSKPGLGLILPPTFIISPLSKNILRIHHHHQFTPLSLSLNFFPLSLSHSHQMNRL